MLDTLAAMLGATAGGRVAIPYEDPESPGRALVLECYRPAGHTPDSPVVIVQHGMGRNGDEYRDAWIPAADQHGLLIVAITFPNASWPDSRTYNDGHVLAEDGAVRPRQGWSNAIPERVFGLLREAGVTTRGRAYLWGHSAGGQFVHRLLGLQNVDVWEAAGVGNPGWYTLPTLSKRYPLGLGGIGLDDAALERMLAYPMVIFAGDQDIHTTASNLPKHEAALAQGRHRFARAHFYLAAGQAEAARRGVTCGWRLVVVPGVGHEGMRMSAVAAAYWFDGVMPAAADAAREVGVEL
jgi:poly(3-hydroxybutyrate) depolymerase